MLDKPPMMAFWSQEKNYIDIHKRTLLFLTVARENALLTPRAAVVGGTMMSDDGGGPTIEESPF